MRTAVNRIGQSLGWCGVALLVAASFPIIALTVIALRTVLFAVALVCVPALALFCLHSPFRIWVGAHARPSGHARP